MDAKRFDGLSRSFSLRVSRRGVLVGLSGGLFIALPLALAVDETAAKNRGKRRKHKKRRKNAQPGPESPPVPGPETPPPPGPVSRADVTCTGEQSTFLFISGAGTRTAQTFTASASGPLVSAALLIDNRAGAVGELILQLSSVDGSGFPASDVLAEAIVANATVPERVSTVAFTFANPTSVVAGTQYALVLSLRGTSDLAGWGARPGDGCGGQGFVSASQTGPFNPVNTDLDLIFTTFVTS